MSETLTVGFIGLGNRGMATLRRWLPLEGVRVTALCDISSVALEFARRTVVEAGGETPQLFDDPELFCRTAPCALMVVATDWSTHASLSAAALAGGHHVAVEVPAATTVEEGRMLVEAAHTSGRICIMMENCCYDPFALQTLEMSRRGELGQLVHCEGAYIHDLRELYRNNPWYAAETLANGANPYPTHGLGPICQLLAVNRPGGDTLVELTSMSATAAGEDVPPINTSMIRTALGRTIMLHHDVSTPRPYSRIQSVSGTKGYITKYPRPLYMADDGTIIEGEKLERMMAERFMSPVEKLYRAEGEAAGVANMMNYLMDRSLIDTIRFGLTPDITVEDAALWSSIAELTARSVADGGAPIAIPKF